MATTTQATFTTSSSDDWAAVMATFKPANQSATTTHMIHTDHLGGTNVVTSASGTVEETLSYYPFGQARLDTTSGFTESKKFTGHEYDTQTGLYYMQARYQEPRMGRFVSEDPAFLAVGNNVELKNITGQTLAQYLSSPQTLNSYSYVANNPLINVDKEGKWLDTVLDVGFIGYDLYKIGGALATGNFDEAKSEGVNLGLDIGGAGLPFVTGLGMARRAEKAGETANRLIGIADVARATNWSNAKTLERHFIDHGGDFNARTARDYARQASDFFRNAQKNGLPTKIDKDGTIRIYDSKSNTFGSYNADGTTKTFYKPDPSKHNYKTNADYWNAQKGKLKK